METSSFTLSWDTDIACDGVIEYGMTEELGMTASALQNNTTNHSANLEGLTPGSIYYARAVCTLEDGTGASSIIRSYATVSESSGDIHVYSSNAG